MAGARIRSNNVFGAVDDNPLTNSATTLNASGLANLAAVSGNHAVLVLDPLRSAGAPEIVVVTAHTAAATSATVTRGAYGTSARQHVQGTLWVHAATIDDMIRIVTSSTRPSDTYEGQLIYETDTNRYATWDAAAWIPGGFVGVVTSSTRPASPSEGQTIYETDTDSYKCWDGSAWEHVMTTGAWTSYTPTLTQSATVTKTVSYAKYMKTGRVVTAQGLLAVTGSGTAANAIKVGLPVAAAQASLECGVGTVFDASVVATYKGIALVETSTTVWIRYAASTGTGLLGTDGFTAALASGDAIGFSVTYEAAS